MIKKRIVIALDGPAGAGKGTVGRAVAKQLNLAYLDTGAIYRALGLLTLRAEIENPESEPARVAALAHAMPFSFKPASENDRFSAFLGTEEVTQTLRQENVGAMASRVAALPDARRALLDFQRRYATPNSALLDGRDVGTVVFPDADLKVFLTASLEERARRRALELQQRGEPVNFSQIMARMAERDTRDAERAHAPLKAADDAVTVDATLLTAEEAVRQVVSWVIPLM